MATTLEELERRVIALEKAPTDNTPTLKWVAGTLAQVKALADDHTERLQRIEASVGGQVGRPDRIEHDVTGLRRDMPRIVADALRRRTDSPAAFQRGTATAGGGSHPDIGKPVVMGPRFCG